MRKLSQFALVGWLCLSGLLAACAGSAGDSAEKPTIRLGYFPNLTHAAAVYGVGANLFQQALGDRATLDIKTFNAGPSLIEALFAGEIDLGYIGPNPAINGYVRSNGEALRIIAGATSGGALFVVRPEANIQAPADLAGKKLATPQLGNTQDVALRMYLRQNGLDTVDKGGTVEIVPTQNSDILNLFQQGQIDGAWVPEPWGTRLIQEANGQVLVDERALWPDGQFVTTHIIGRTEFLSAHPDWVKILLQAHVAAVQAIQADPAAALGVINQEIERITGSRLPDQVLTEAFKNLTITYDPVASSLFVSAEHAFDLGFLGDTAPDLSGIYDLAPLNAVLAEKGLPAITLPTP